MDDKEKNIHLLAETYNEMLLNVTLPDMKVDDLLDLIDFYTSNGMDFEAEMYKRIAALKFPTHPDVVLMCAHWEADEGNWTNASNLYNSMDCTSYDDALFYMEKLLRMMLPAEAYNKMLSTINPLYELSDYDFLYDSAELFKDFGFMEYSIRCADAIPSSYPDYRQVLELKAECYFYMTRFSDSLSEIDKAIDINSFDDYLWSQAALLHYKNKDLCRALDACEYSLAILKDNPRAEHLKNVVKWHEDSSFDIDAATSYRQDYSAMVEIGDLHYLKEDYKKAETAYMAAGYYCPRGNRDRILIAFKTSLCRINQDRANEAVVTFLSVLNQGFDLWPYAVELLHLLLKCGKSEYVMTLFTPIIRLDDISVARLEAILLVLCQYKCFDDAHYFWTRAFGCENKLSESLQPILKEAKDYFSRKN